MTIHKYKIVLLFTFLMIFSSCEEFIDEQPFNQISNEIVLTNPSDVNSLVLGIYSDGLQDGNLFGQLEIGMTGLLSDELVHTGSFPTYIEMDNNQISSQNVTLYGYWFAHYQGIYLSNFLLENIDDITFTNQGQKNQYIGEAKWCRALHHFMLTRLFGDVPIASTTNLNALAVLPRSPRAEVIQFVIEDLLDAEIRLADASYASAAEARNRATEWAAKALLARVYLFNGNLAEAGNKADDVIENGPFSLDPSYQNVFAGSSNESIFQVFFNAIDGNSLAFFFQEAGRYEYAPSPQLLAAFESEDDVRLSVISETGAGQPQGVKYTDVATGSDQPVLLRLAEMHLIRAEARLGTEQALADVNLIRSRAGLSAKESVTLDDILQERFVEFTFEGMRWYDLVRTGRASAVQSVINPNTWQDTDVLLPIPQDERNLNPNLSQNPGY